VTPKKVTKLCLALPEAVEEQPFGPDVEVYKVHGKVFALLREGRVSLKCEPELARDLRARFDGIIPGYHLNKRHWNTVSLDGSIPEDLIEEMVEASYDLVVASLPKMVRLRLHRG
jgi:predicted DNA-binding protein (MmcQ/YjbR family)